MTSDLTGTFGESAASRLRGLLPPRAVATEGGDARAGGPVPSRSGPSGPQSAPSGPRAASSAPSASSTARTANGSARRRPAGAAGTTNRRWGRTRVGSPQHVDLLLLAALRHGPDDAAGVIDRIRTESGGALEAPVRTVHRALHRLTRNRLLARVGPGPRYRLTPTGERALRARSRQWRAFVRAVDAVVTDEDDA